MRIYSVGRFHNMIIDRMLTPQSHRVPSLTGKSRLGLISYQFLFQKSSAQVTESDDAIDYYKGVHFVSFATAMCETTTAHMFTRHKA